MAKNQNRDEFTPATKRTIERQGRGHCSNPGCRRLTHAASSDGPGEISIGEAAHICAAAPGGPRYDPNMTPGERRSAGNGIWLCEVHARAVDAKDSKFSVELLREWKNKTDEDSWRSIMHNIPYGPGMQPPTPDELRDRLRAAATADLEVFKRTAKWPATTVSLTLKVDHVDEALSTRALANAVATLDDLILVAPPGMGKTTTLFQIAEGILENGGGMPLVVPLGDWATEGASLLDSILKRPGFRGISEDEFRAVAAKPGVVMLLDGWNELDGAARKRAIAQVEALKAELPELGLVISARKQAFDVPFAATRVDLLPLNEEQQMEIATALRGEAGARIIDQAWRTAGIRELVTIPLYLTSLLYLPENAAFPTTKEEVLRHFVAAQEKEPRHAEALRAVVNGFQQDYLDGLAVFATSTANTSIADSNAHRSISNTENLLVSNGQITITRPDDILDVLVSNHVLMRAGDTPGYAFQHQQFQEWYASHSVERLMMKAINDATSRDQLRAEILDKRPWEEAVLFAVERLARGDEAKRRACGAAILAAFEVDPILAAEMIFRSTDAVWASISSEIQGLVRKWHKPGKVDRALGFMITSGRPEFFDLVWPLITHESDQVHLHALRASRPFRPSLLGSDAPKRIAALSPEIRKNVLHEIASNSGIDGLDLATAIAKTDDDPEVKAIVVDALAFRRADRHVAEVLSTADEKTFDLVAKKHLIEDVQDAAVREGVKAAHERQQKEGMSHHERLRSIIYDRTGNGQETEITAIVAEMEIDRNRDFDRYLLYEVRQRYPQALAEGLLIRVREGRELFYGADDVLASAGFVLEDDALTDIAISKTSRRDDRAEAAASVLGPKAVGRMTEVYLEAKKRVLDASGKYDEAAGDRFHDLRARIGHTPGASLIAAVQDRAAASDYEEIAELAELLSRPSHGEDDRARPFSAEGLAAIGVLAQDWGARMLASGDAAKRSQVASIAALISHAPSVHLLPTLKVMLDDNLQRYREFREEAIATGWKSQPARDEATHPHTHEYQWAFLAINAPETAELMKEYLADEHFGELAATVLASHWTQANEPKDGKKIWLGVDFSRVEEHRARRVAHPDVTSAEAEAIFHVIDNLIADGSTDDQKKRAVALGTLAIGLPHGHREATIQKLIAFAPRRARANLLLSLVLSGENIDVNTVAAGISEILEAAKKEPWILTQSDGYEFKEWLRLIPFVNRPADALAIVGGLPDQQRNPYFLEEMIRGFGEAPSNEAEEVLFKFAEADARFYANHSWRDSVLRRGTLSAARRFIDLTAQGVFDAQTDDWHMARQISGLIAEHDALRAHVYALLKDGPTSRGLGLLARAVAENPDAEGLLLLIRFETEQKGSFMGRRTVEGVVTEHVASEDWKGAYNVVPVQAAELRKKLLAMTTSGGADDPAARCLNLIDEIRDESGAPENEPRHPDLASRRNWPMLTVRP